MNRFKNNGLYKYIADALEKAWTNGDLRKYGRVPQHETYDNPPIFMHYNEFLLIPLAIKWALLQDWNGQHLGPDI